MILVSYYAANNIETNVEGFLCNDMKTAIEGLIEVMKEKDPDGDYDLLDEALLLVNPVVGDLEIEEAIDSLSEWVVEFNEAYGGSKTFAFSIKEADVR
jgi:hypothetical protein